MGIRLTDRDPMSEMIVGEIVDCPRCGISFTPWGAEVHAHGHRLADLLTAGAIEMNARGVDFQAGQVWSRKHGPRGRARVAAKAAAR